MVDRVVEDFGSTGTLRITENRGKAALNRRNLPPVMFAITGGYQEVDHLIKLKVVTFGERCGAS